MIDYPLDAFLFYRSYRESLNGMTQKDQLATLLAIIDYALYGVEPDLRGKMPAAVFTVTRPIIDANNAKRKAGKKGGRPKKKTNGFLKDETIGLQSEKPDPFNNIETRNEKHRNETDTPLNPPKGGKRERFMPPSVEEVTEYVKQRGSRVDPQGFIDFYEAKGWMIGKTPMKDWKAACRNAESWERWQKKPDSQTAVKTDADYDSGESFV